MAWKIGCGGTEVGLTYDVGQKSLEERFSGLSTRLCRVDTPVRRVEEKT